METNEDVKKVKRPKSATRYPKRMPTYVVAFSVQEPHDDPSKNQQISKKRSVEASPSVKSISPTGSTNSAKTFTITPTEKLSHVLDIPTISEVKIDIIDENQCGDVEKKSPQISSYIVVDNRMADEQPEIIFNATKHMKRCKDDNKFLRKKPKKNKRVIKLKNVHFKYKNQKNNITRRLERYYEKAKLNSPNPEQIQKHIYSNVLSKVVSRSRVLKKVLAKENLLDDSDRISLYDDLSINGYDDGSLASSPSTTKKSFTSYASQNTLVHKSSSSSRNEDFYSIKTANSVIQVSSDIVTPYKTDIINVAIAVAYNTSKQTDNYIANNSQEKFIHKENLTSDETFVLPNNDLTSESPSHDNTKFMKIDYDQLTMKPIISNEKDLSSETLTAFDKKSVVGVSSDDDTFVIARTSSDFNKSSINSDFTLTSNSETTLRNECLHSNLQSKDDIIQDDLSKKADLLDTVINLGFYPEMTPSTSSGANFGCDINDVIVTENLMNNFQLDPKIKGDDLAIDIKNNLSNVLKKSFDVEKLEWPQKKISLPNDLAIKANLKDAEKSQKHSCSDDVRNDYPTDLNEMWDRLTLVLDLAVKRLEESLAEKIVKELKKSLSIFNQLEHQVPKFNILQTEIKPQQIKNEESNLKMLHKEVFVLEDYLKPDADNCVQCDLVQNQVIDQLMLKLSIEGPKVIPTSTVSLKKLKKPEIVRDYFEILKPPADEIVVVEVGKGDTTNVSTATGAVTNEDIKLLHKLKLLFSGPIAFIRENAFIVSSVPTFFVVMLCLYITIVIIMKP